MPIRINLLNEALAEQELRRRDPVKRALFLGIFLAVLSLVWFSSAWLEYKLIQQKKSQLDIEIDQHKDEFAAVQANQKRIADSEQRLNALLSLNTNRFLQGNLLNALQKIYVPSVQLLRMRMDQTFAYKEGRAAQTNSYGTVPGQPATSTEHTVLVLDAKDSSSPNPGDQINHYKEALGAQEFFKSRLDPTNGLKLSNFTSPQSAVGGKPFVQFTLECRFPDKTR